MKYTLLVLSVLSCLIVPALTGDTIEAMFSSSPGTPGTPPQNASVFSSEAKAAVAERNWTNALLLTTRGIT